MGENVSRRTFLGLGAAAALSATSLMGCAPQPTSRSDETIESDKLSETGTRSNTLNPQDPSFLEGESDYAALFDPIQLGSLTLANRLVKSSAGSYSIDAGINDQAIGFYEGLAKGGVGMIWHEDLSFYPYTPQEVKPLVDKVHEHGTPIGLQCYIDWSRAATSKHLVSPLEMDIPEFRHTAMTVDEIHGAQDEIVARAQFARECGFDAISINCSCDHCFDTFLSRFWNDREDEYGPQSFENRARIVTEIIGRIKQELGSDFMVDVLFNGIEEDVHNLGDSSLCIKPDEAMELAKLFEDAGADSLQIRSSMFGNHCAGFMPDIMHFGEHGNTGLGTVIDYSRHAEGSVIGSRDGAAALAEVAAQVKQAVSIPVGVVGSIDPRLAPRFTNDLVAEGKVDFLVLNRTLLADPDMPNKLKEGKRDEVRPCNRCVNCFKAVADMYGIGYCRVNPSYIRGGTEEMPEGAMPLPAESPRTIIVAGGGPAGLEAAAIAAQRGHKVTLYEEKDSLGGRLSFAQIIKGDHERLEDYRSYLEKRVRDAGVNVVTCTPVDAALINQEKPDAVIIATGGSKCESTIKGSELAYDLDDVATAEPGERVVIVGGNIISTDLAVKLTGEGHEVILMSERPEAEIGIEQASWPHCVMMPWLKAKGSKLIGGASITEVAETSVSYRADNGLDRTVECDTVFLLEDLQAAGSWVDEIDSSIEVHLVGDSKEPSNILNAVHSAHLAARAL